MQKGFFLSLSKTICNTCLFLCHLGPTDITDTQRTIQDLGDEYLMAMMEAKSLVNYVDHQGGLKALSVTS